MSTRGKYESPSAIEKVTVINLQLLRVSFSQMLQWAQMIKLSNSRAPPVTSMLETKCVGDNSKMLETVFAIFVTNTHYLFTLASDTNIQKMSPKSKFSHQHHCHQITNNIASAIYVSSLGSKGVKRSLGPWTTLVMTSMPSEHHDLLIFGFYNWFQDIVIELFWGSWKVNLTEVVWFIAMRSFNWIYFRKINLSSRSARKKTIL